MFRFCSVWTLGILNLVCCVFSSSVYAQPTLENSTVFLPVARASESPLQIALSWPAIDVSSGVQNIQIYRNVFGDTVWTTPIAELSIASTGYVDSAVQLGVAYQYKIVRVKTGEAFDFDLVYGAIKRPEQDQRGKVALLVDSTFSSSLEVELRRLTQDLVGDGWQVLRHDIPRAMSAPEVKQILKSDYQLYGTSLKTALLLGHIAVPYSGLFGLGIYPPPDGHSDHKGAWSTDQYYADLDGVWTDSPEVFTGGDVSFERLPHIENRNFGSDGVFDQSQVPSKLELAIGRVDFFNLTGFLPKNEEYLLKEYLNKNHNYRQGGLGIPKRGLFFDRFNSQLDTAAQKMFANIFGHSQSFHGELPYYAEANSYLLSFFSGAGFYQGIYDTPLSTLSLPSKNYKSVFSQFHGSYFGDFDTRDNFLRAALASGTHTLATWWSSAAIAEAMSVGESLGQSFVLGQNSRTSNASLVLNILGDPTLRFQQVKPASDLNASIDAGSLKLSWTASPEQILGYAVYKSATPMGPFERLNAAPLIGTSYTVGPAAASAATYMVRALNLESMGNASYYNLSQGTFLSINVTSTGTGFQIAVVDPGTTPDALIPPSPVDLTPKTPTIHPVIVTPSAPIPGDLITVEYRFSPGPMADSFWQVGTYLHSVANGSWTILDSHMFPVMQATWLNELKYKVKIMLSGDLASGDYEIWSYMWENGTNPLLIAGPGTTARADSKAFLVGRLTIPASTKTIGNVRILNNSSTMNVLDTIRVAWDSTDVSAVKIDMVEANTSAFIGDLTAGIINSGAYTDVIKDNYHNGTKVLQVKIRISDIRDKRVVAYSPSFSLVDNNPPAVPRDPTFRVYYNLNGAHQVVTVEWLTWDWDTNYYGFSIYHGRLPGTYGTPFEVIDAPYFELLDPEPGLHYFRILAYDRAGLNQDPFTNTVFNRSALSEEFVVDVPVPDEDFDGTPDANDCAPKDKLVWRNQAFADADSDGIADSATAVLVQCFGKIPPAGNLLTGNGPDNCPRVSNPDQADLDQDGVGNACDPDYISPSAPGQPGGLILG